MMAPPKMRTTIIPGPVCTNEEKPTAFTGWAFSDLTDLVEPVVVLKRIVT